MRAYRIFGLIGAAVLIAGSAVAGERIGVVTSIKPVNSLVAAVMQGVGKPHLIVKGGASPHSYSLKPSDAKALQKAKVVFWVGHDLEAFLEDSIETLATKARVVVLEDSPGLVTYKFREGGPFEARDDDDHGKEAKTGRGEQPQGGVDMHLWLDPMNAGAMVKTIQAALAAADPANDTTYKANAKAVEERLEALTRDIAALLAPVKDRPFIVFHDAYQYFEKRFGVTTAGSITVSPEIMPGARHMHKIRSKVKALGATCVFSEPQFRPKLIEVVTEGTKARSGVLDPVGADLEDGPELYFRLIRNMGKAMKGCLSPSS